MKKFLYIAAMTMLLASCTEDFKDWTTPQSNTQGEKVTFGNGTITPVDVIDFGALSDDIETVQVCEINAVTSSDPTYVPEYTITLNGEEFPLEPDGTMDAKDLEQYVVVLYGQEPVVRTLTAQVKCIMNNEATAVAIVSDEFNVRVIPDAPTISSAYYYIGSSNNWTACDASYQLSNGGGDVYANPVFSVVVPAVYDENGVRTDNWFKIYSQETMDLGVDNFWNGDFIGYPVNGENEMSGEFIEGANDVIAFAFKIPADIEADKYRLTFDMFNRTFTIEPLIDLGEPDLWYLVGSCIGNGSWVNEAGNVGIALIPMYPKTDNYNINTYVGYFPAGQGFKLIHTPGNWDEQWGQKDGIFVKNDGGSGDITVPEDGYYEITYDMQADALTIMKYAGTVAVYSQIGMPGGYQGWDTGSNLMDPMSTVVENHDWIIKGVTYDATELKFAADNSWDVNWGGAAFPLGLGEHNGPNIPVEAGTYDVIFNDILGEYYFIAK